MQFANTVVYHDRLAGFLAVLHDYRQRLCIECPLDNSSDPLHRGEHVAHLVSRQFGESGDQPLGTDKDMSGEDRLEVDKGVRQGRLEKDLGRANRDRRAKGEH